MEVITQTNRTMLIEEINPEKMDLITLVGDTKTSDSLSDDQIKEINSHLLVHSFGDFLDRFAPVVYTFFNSANQRVMYTLKKPEHIPDDMLTEIHLNEHQDFLKMLMTLIETKRSQGIMNVDFKFEKILELISPRKVMEDIRQARKEIRYQYGKHEELEDGDPAKLDIGDKLNVLLEEASDNYSNVLAMLPIAIEDIKTRLLLGEANAQKDNTPLTLGVLSMGENGELKVLEAPKQTTTALATLDDNINQGLIEVLREDYNSVADEPSSYVESLVIRTFCPLPSTMVTDIDVETEIANYNSYLEFYQKAKDDFVHIVKPLAESILGVKMFFEQCPSKVKEMRPSLLVTNCTPEMLAKAGNVTRLITFLNTLNAKNDFNNTIWYSIIPQVALDPRKKTKLKRERFKGNEIVESTNTNEMESVVRLMDVMKDYRVQTFFSFEGNEFTTFNMLAIEGVDKYMNRCAPLIGKEFSEFAVPCFPNFTVVPKDKSGLVLDKRMVLNDEYHTAELSKEKEDIMRLWIEGVYIGAAYVAAGITAATQSPDYLKMIFKRNVDANLPGVRFDIEEGNHALKVRTTLAKEITGFTNNIKDDINRRNFGFVFSSENAMLDGRAITQIMVYKARNLLYMENAYEPIYKTQVTTYIERILRHGTGDFKADNIKFFFSGDPTSQKSRWMEKREQLNGILHMGDDVEAKIDAENGICTLDITFNGDSRNLELEVNRLAAVATA